MKVQSQNDKYHIGARSTEHLISNFMLFVPCIFLQLMTNSNLLRVLKEKRFEFVRAYLY